MRTVGKKRGPKRPNVAEDLQTMFWPKDPVPPSEPKVVLPFTISGEPKVETPPPLPPTARLTRDEKERILAVLTAKALEEQRLAQIDKAIREYKIPEGEVFYPTWLSIFGDSEVLSQVLAFLLCEEFYRNKVKEGIIDVGYYARLRDISRIAMVRWPTETKDALVKYQKLRCEAVAKYEEEKAIAVAITALPVPDPPAPGIIPPCLRPFASSKAPSKKKW